MFIVSDSMMGITIYGSKYSNAITEVIEVVFQQLQRNFINTAIIYTQ